MGGGVGGGVGKYEFHMVESGGDGKRETLVSLEACCLAIVLVVLLLVFCEE